MASHHKHTVPVIAACLFTSFLFWACGGSTDRFHLEGQFKNLNQGEFYIYSLEQGFKDTIAVNDGRFSYVRMMKDTTTLLMLFPNYSELPVFASPGAEVRMEGDVTHLRETKITGTRDNEDMTAFRIKTGEKMPPDVQKEALRFINEHPTSSVSNFLLRRHFLQVPEPDYQQALKLCAKLRKAQPQNQQLARLHTLLTNLTAWKTDGPLPQFSAVSTQGDTISNATLKKDVNVITVWASWNFESQNVFRTLQVIDNLFPKRLSVVAICLDASPSEGKKYLERDSIQWPNICDGQLWQSPVLSQLGIATLPANIIVDKQGNIVARNLSMSDLKDKIEALLKE